MRRRFSTLDKFILGIDNGLKTLTGGFEATRMPAFSPHKTLSNDTNKHTSGLMRINHTGEVCAQALYQGQALTAKSEQTRENLKQAAREEIDHLVWCEQRLSELNSQPSILNPIFYGLSFSLGAITGAISDEVSFGFVAATEEQVCLHLSSHLAQIDHEDKKTYEMLNLMLDDETEHKNHAISLGGTTFSKPIQWSMKQVAKIMTTTTYHI